MNESDLLTGKVRCRSPLLDKGKDFASLRNTRIKNIFMLCGNHRELAHHVRTPIPDDRKVEAVLDVSTPIEVDNSLAATRATFKKVLPFQIAEDKVMELPVGDELKKELFGQLIEENKENITLEDESMRGFVEAYVRWEAAKELGGKFITKLEIRESSNIADLRLQIEAYLGIENKNQAFSFLMHGGVSLIASHFYFLLIIIYISRSFFFPNSTSWFTCFRLYRLLHYIVFNTTDNYFLSTGSDRSSPSHGQGNDHSSERTTHFQ